MFVLSIQNSACRIRSTCRSELSHNVNTYTFQQLLISVFGSSEHFLVVLCSMEVFCFHCCQPFTLICSQRPRHSLENVRVQRLKIRERAGMWGESVVADDKLTRVHDTLLHCLSHTHTVSHRYTDAHTRRHYFPSHYRPSHKHDRGRRVAVVGVAVGSRVGKSAPLWSV